MPVPTTEQSAILDAASLNDSLLVEARAGSGKTTTLIQLLPRLRGSTCLMAFNKSIANELKLRTADLPMTTKLSLEIGTVHALGLKAYSKNEGKKPRINGGKVSYIHKDLMGSNRAKADYFRPVNYLLTRIVSAAKNSGFGLPFPSFPDIDDEDAWLDLLEHFNLDTELESAGVRTERAIEHCQLLLKTSNNQRTIIDFDDMIYLPLLFQHTLPKFDNVLIDEAQDISPTRRELAFGMLSSRGRIIAVGDEFQAIYGFTGADANSLAEIASRSRATRLPLTTCWRCDGDIIAEAQRLVPDIKARPSAPAGKVHSIPMASLVEGSLGNLPAEKLSAVEDRLPREGDAILCRLNKPNVATALALIRAGKRARIEGRDLGQRLLSHIKASTPTYALKPLAELVVDLEDWGQQQCNLLAAKDRQASADLLQDEVDCAVLILERAMQRPDASWPDVEWLVDDLFGDDIPPSGVITLSSVHKAKGREWPRVFILGRGDYMPFWRAEKDWELQQERNLIYVAITRAEQELIYVTDVRSWLDSRKESR